MDYNYGKIDPADPKHQRLKLPKTYKMSLKFSNKIRDFRCNSLSNLDRAIKFQ